MKTSRLVIAAVAACGLAAVPVIPAGAAEKVTICHNTHSGSNPVVIIDIGVAASNAHKVSPGHNPALGGQDGSYDGEGGCYYPD